MKKRANILLETVIGVSIILSMFLIVTSLISENEKTASYRKNIEEGNRVLYCVVEEVKYNTKIDEILELTSEDTISLEYYDNFLNDLCNKSLLKMKRGDGITISTSNTEDLDKIYVDINISLNNSTDILEKKFIKYKWMEYYDRN